MSKDVQMGSFYYTCQTTDMKTSRGGGGEDVGRREEIRVMFLVRGSLSVMRRAQVWQV